MGELAGSLGKPLVKPISGQKSAKIAPRRSPVRVRLAPLRSRRFAPLARFTGEARLPPCAPRSVHALRANEEERPRPIADSRGRTCRPRGRPAGARMQDLTPILSARRSHQARRRTQVVREAGARFGGSAGLRRYAPSWRDSAKRRPGPRVAVRSASAKRGRRRSCGASSTRTAPGIGTSSWGAGRSRTRVHARTSLSTAQGKRSS